MSANKTESDNKTISREELKQRLQKLVERDRAAVAVFAARCALRVLPYTAGKGNFDPWQENRDEHVQSLFVACVLGLEYDSIDGNIRVSAPVDSVALPLPPLPLPSTPPPPRFQVRHL